MPEVRLGVLVAPILAGGFVQQLIPDLTDELRTRDPGVRWRIEVISDALVQPPADDDDIASAARERLLDRGWDMALC